MAKLKNYTVLLYSIPCGEAWTDWVKASNPSAAVKQSLKQRKLKTHQVEVIGVFCGHLTHENVDGFKQFPVG